MSNMEKDRSFPSIFNDVIGPVMRGPSSSHCAAALRIGRIARDLMGSALESVLIEYDPNGSLATTHESQGSHMGLCGGLMGWDADDSRLVASPRALAEAGVDVRVEIVSYGARHPNTYRLTLRNAHRTHRMIALSTGGGAIEVIEIDGLPVSIRGDYFETIVQLNDDIDGTALAAQLQIAPNVESAVLLTGTVDSPPILIEANSSPPQNGRPRAELSILVRSRRPLSSDLLSEIESFSHAIEIIQIAPVLPILSRNELTVPFLTCAEMLAYQPNDQLDLWQLAIEYESVRGGVSSETVLEQMDSIIAVMERAIEQGIEGTDYADRILGPQARYFQTEMDAGRLLGGTMLNRMILYTTAVMETKSAMGVIVAAPTAGACGALPGAVIAAAEEMGLPTEAKTEAMLAAGIVGVFIAEHATFAAEVAGCQAECGAGSGMAAAALVTLAGGATEQAVSAASMAMQNTLGMICDPVANRVEVPCLGRNVLAASNALACANMALAGFDAIIPLDETIETMARVGASMPCEVRCTGLGGLSVTPTSQRIELELANL